MTDPPERTESIATGRWVSIRPVTATDLDYLYSLCMEPDIGFRWRYGGVHLDPDQFRRGLWDGVLAQFVIVSSRSGHRIGLAVGLNADLRNRYVHFAALLDPQVQGSGWAFEGVVLAVDYLFTGWDFRKIYIESAGHIAQDYERGLLRYGTLEGELKEHAYLGGRYWPMRIFAIYRRNWEEIRSKLLPRRPAISPPEDHTAT